MPDTTIAFDVLSSHATDVHGAPLLDAAQMGELLTAYEAAGEAFKDENGYVRERDEERVSAAFSDAQNRLLYARTVDPEGIAIKVKVLDQRGDIARGLLPEIFADLMRPRPAPSLVEVCRAISEAAAPHTEQGGGIKSEAGLAGALVPLIGHYTVADAVCAIAMLHSSYEAIGGEDGDDGMFAALMLLEDFACRADAADADSAQARAFLVKKGNADGWDLDPDNLSQAARHVAAEVRKMRAGGAFGDRAHGSTFRAFVERGGYRDDDLPAAAE